MPNSLFGNDYDSVQVGGGKALPSGGYICRIIKARLTQSRDGLPMVEALFDICEGEYANYFGDKHRENMKRDPNAEYPKNGRIKVVAVDKDGKTKRTFKGFNTSVEHSNDMILPRENVAYLNALSGKLVGVIFGREEFEGTDGKMHWTTKPRWYRSVADIESGNYDVPDDVYATQNSYYGGLGDMPDSFSAAQDDIPF